MAGRKRIKRAADATVRLVGYVRVSTEDQSREGVSLGAQRERLAAYATAHGHELVGIEEDAVSGKVNPDQREGLARALELVRTGKADGLVVLKLDRLSRSTRDILDLVDETGSRAGWRLVSVSENLDTATAAGRLVITVLAALSQMEREQVIERTCFAMDSIAREGRGRSRYTPFGWRTTDGSTENRAGDRSELVPHADEQAAIRRIIRHRKQGKGARRIATALNREGPNPRTGNPWTPEGVAAILRRLDRWESAGVNPLAA